MGQNHVKHFQKPRAFLRSLAPNLMWCTSQELFEMYEQINEDYPIESFRVILTQEKRNGTFIAKQLRSNDGRGKPLLYLRTDA